ncbi:MAG: lytic transglycosylase domain-containing protein [Acidobacteriia bacterium]|nr:lytic transglycosylase domain-containing protein [Terriglobia bacterium]
MRAAMEKQRAAAEIQREAGRKQAELLKQDPLIYVTEPSPDAPPPCEPIGDAAVNPIIESTEKKLDLEKGLLRAVIRQESQFYPCAVSEKGAEGLMQLMPATAEQLGVKDPFDPKQSIEGGAKYLKQLIDKYTNLGTALGAYNAGPGAVDEVKGIPDIPETRNYVDSILQSLGKKP